MFKIPVHSYTAFKSDEGLIDVSRMLNTVTY